jgi:hypothetical protein
VRASAYTGAIIVGMIALGALPAIAAAPGLQISVQPLVVQFAVAPGGQASTHVVIKNVGTAPAVVMATQFDWQTTVDGLVKTEKPGAHPGSSLDPFLRLTGSEFTLAPGEARTLTLSLTLPTTFAATPRDYWGGFLVRAVPADSPAAGTFGVGANILAYETVGLPSRHVKLTALRVTDEGAHTVQVSARMLNDGQNFVRPQIRMELEQAGRIVQSRDDSTPAIFAASPRLYTRTLRDLAPGAYRLQLTIDYGGETLVQGTTAFTVH